MPFVRHVKNKAGAEAVVIGITDDEWKRLGTEKMFQTDIRKFVTGLASIIIVRGKTEAEMAAVIDPDSLRPYVIAGLPKGKPS
jgi:hypothetical protein